MEIVLSVSQCVEAINIALDSLGELTVEGEVSGFNIIQNKWVTFDIKDKQSVLKCFMTVWNLRIAIEDGMLIKVTGQPNLRPKGFLSFVVQTVKPSGEGSLKRAFELLKKKLQEEGIFAPERKRPLPRFPQHIALITSRDAAAYADFLKVLKARQGGLIISFIHTQVQGDDAPRQIIEALATANTDIANLDAIILVRGGGSLEDLIAFNDEHVVRAVASSRTPTIVGIGHERDVSLAELAADLRASTPSNAAELVVRSREEITGDITRMQTNLSHVLTSRIRGQETAISNLTHAIGNRFKATSQKTNQLITSITAVASRMKDGIASSAQQIDGMRRILSALSPEQTLKRGYSITKTQDGRLVRHMKDITNNQEIITTLSDGSIRSVVREPNA